MNTVSPSEQADLPRQQGFFYGWIIVFVCFMVISLAFSVRLSFGIFFEELTRGTEFSWSRAGTAGVFSLSMLVFALTSPFVGWLLDRLGARRVFMIGILALASGLFMTSFIDTLWQFYLYYGIWTGLGISILGLAIHAATISRWFDRQHRRGLAIGLAFSGSGIGILVMAPVLEWIISAYNWRAAYLFLASLFVILALPITLVLLRDSPGQPDQPPDTIQPDEVPVAPEMIGVVAPVSGAWTWKAAARTRLFWVLMGVGMLSFFTLRMTTVHQVAHFVDHGIPRLTAATVLGSAGLVTALAFIGFGSLSDRIGRETAFYIGSAAQVLALLLLIGIGNGAPLVLLYIFALLWGIGEGSRSGLLTAIASDTFPGPALGAIVGTLGGFFGLGAALGSWFGGLFYDWIGGYTVAFVLALLATLAATAGIYLTRRLSANE